MNFSKLHQNAKTSGGFDIDQAIKDLEQLQHSVSEEQSSLKERLIHLLEQAVTLLTMLLETKNRQPSE